LSKFIFLTISLKLLKLFLGRCSLCLGDFKHVESDSFAERSAFTNGGGISNFGITESRWNVDRDSLVALLIPVILANVVKVIPTYNTSSLHFHLSDYSSQDTSSNGYISSEWAFFVNVVANNCFSGCFESKTNSFCVSQFLLLGSKSPFGIEENSWLLLKSSLCL